MACIAQASETKPPAASVQLLTDQLPAIGKQSTLLNVGEFGRYTVLAESPQGTALQLIDRMAGPGEIAGIAGEQDGRLDLFLNRGDYKIITHAHEFGTGNIKLSVHSFTELHGNNFPQLIKLKDIALSLDDFQQRSFWLHIDKQETVAIEAAGRNLADLRLWKDGNWLLDITPVAKQIYPHPEKPLQAMQLNVKLEPGLYLMTAYGGPSQSWTEQSEEHPLYIRYGIPRLDESGERRYIVSVFGTDRFRVPGNSNYFNLSVPEATAISMVVDTFQEDAAFSGSGRSAEISKKSIPPVTELELGTQTADRLLTITSLAGQSYILQHFEKRWRYSFNRSGAYWLSSIHSGATGDSVDATSILTRTPRFQSEQFMDARVIKLDQTERYERRFNLLDNLTLYLEITEPGKYRVTGQGEGVAAEFLLEPFLTSRPKDYQAPPFENSGFKWDLDTGFYVLTARPKLKGILTLVIEKEGYQQFRDSTMPTVAGATRYGVVKLDGDSFYTLYVNQQPGVQAGIVLRPAPVDLSTSLPVMQRGNEIVTIPVKVPEAGTVRALTLTGAALELSLNQQKWVKQLMLASGDYELTVRNPGSDTVNYALEFSATRLNELAPLPPLPPILRSPPNFPNLVPEQPVYFDLDRDQPATYMLKVDKPALYSLETSGLLETEGNLRTRTNPSLVRQQANGVGRNFLIQQYLREGDYQLTVKPRYRSRGHLGLSVASTTIEDGGSLTPGVAARATLKAGKGLAYRFAIPEKGKYRLRAIGTGRTYLMRLEDADGWPIEAPNIAADITQDFDAGEYRMIIRPEAVDARVVATLDAMTGPIQFHGHGPHHISIGQTAQHEWLEPEAGGQRTPDVWTFAVPAAADISITLNKEMHGDLYSGELNAQNRIAAITTLKPWQGKLPAGQYQLAVKSLRKSNHISYQLAVNSQQLMIGQQRHSAVPETIPIAVGKDGFIELWSYGTNDVRARLLDDKGNVVAQGDDRSNDWNFLIAQKLQAGDYQLEVEAVGNNTQATMVYMGSPNIRIEDPQDLPVVTSISDNDAHVYPLRLPDKKSLLVVQAQSNDAVGISVELQNRGAERSMLWTELGSATGKAPYLLLPYTQSAAPSYRIRVWSVDRRGAHISLQVVAIEPKHYLEQQFSKSGIMLDPVPGSSRGSSIAVAAVDLSRAGVFRVDDAENVFWSSQSNGLLSKTYNGLLSASTNTLWIAKRIAANEKTTRLSGKRIVLGEAGGSRLQVALPPHQQGQLDIKADDEPILVVAESRVGQAGVQLIEDMAISEPLDARQFAIAQRSAAAVAVKPSNSVLKFWNAGDQREALELSFRHILFKTNDIKTVGSGLFQEALPAATALPLQLPPGLKRITLTFPPATAAVMRQQSKTVSIHWSGKTALNEVIRTRADEILILNADTKAQHIAVTVESLATIADSKDAELVLTENRMFQLYVANTGQLRLPVQIVAKASEENTRTVVRIRGTAQGTYIQNSGRILRGNDLTTDEPGELLLEHQPGTVLAWLDSHAFNLQHNDHAKAPLPVLDVTVNQTLSLQGEQQFFQANVQDARQLQLRSDTALITRITYANGKEIVEAHPQGVNYSVYLPAGYTKIAFHGLGPSGMSGVLFVSSMPLVSIREGYGPESILSGSGVMMYQFEVSESGAIGLGIQASSDVVSGELMDSSGNVISHGVVHMPVLAPGRYVFAIRVPPDSLPVRVRPALVGLERPPAGPPWEVIKEYLEQAGRKLDQPSLKP